MNAEGDSLPKSANREEAQVRLIDEIRLHDTCQEEDIDEDGKQTNIVSTVNVLLNIYHCNV